MKLRRILLTATAVMLALMAGLMTCLAGIGLSAYNRRQAETTLTLSAESCVGRLNTLLESGMARTELLAASDAAPALLKGSGDAAPDKLWMGLQGGAVLMLVSAQGRISACSDEALVGLVAAPGADNIAAMQSGRTVVSQEIGNLYAGAPVGVSILSPVFDEDTYAGYALMHLDESVLAQVVEECGSVFGTTVLFDGTGRRMAESGDVPYDSLQHLFNLSNFRTQMSKEKVFSFRLNRTQYVAAYRPLSAANWNVLCEANPKSMTMPGWWLLLPTVVTLLAALIYLRILRWIVERNYALPMENLRESIRLIESGDYSRSVPYLGRLELGEVGTAFNQMLGRIRRDHTELTIKEERYRILNEQTNSIIFEFNIENGEVTCSPNGRMLANYPACMEDFPHNLIARQGVCAADGEKLEKLFYAMTKGRKTGEQELQVRTYNGKLCWFHLQLSTITDTVSLKPLRVVGKLTDIDEEKHDAEMLVYKAERDALTSLYNKETTRSVIVQSLANRADSMIDALLIADVDNFKRVNDGYGHQKGDAILAAVAKKMKDCVGADNVTGRMGGDEFMMLLCTVTDAEEVERVACELTRAVRTVVLNEETGETMSISLGIALCPQDGISYQQLYAHADNALYAAKRTGKNGYAFYRDEV